MGCTPCQARAKARREGRSMQWVYTYPEGTSGPGGETTHVYRTEVEAKAAAIRWGGGTVEAK